MKNIHHLLELIREEKTWAFNMFYDLYYEQVFRYAYYFLKDTEACREVVADVFFSIWKSRRRLQDIENLETYLFISVRNAAFHYSKNNNRYTHLALEELPVQIEMAEESPFDRISYQEMQSVLGKVIGKLPERCRLIFLMARHEQLKPKEIAEKLCISENTVRVQMKIAVEKILTQLKSYYPDITFSFLWPFFFFTVG